MEIIVFHKLNQEEIDKIISIMLKEVVKRLQDQNMKIEIDDSVKELISKKGIDTNYGARPLRRTIQNLVEDKLAEEILDGNLKAESEGKLIAKDDKIELKVKTKK